MEAPSNDPRADWARGAADRDDDNSDQLQQVVIEGAESNGVASQGMRAHEQPVTVIVAAPRRDGQEEVSDAGVAQEAPPAAREADPSPLNRQIERLLRALGFRGPQRARVRYPTQFKALAAIVLGVSISWVGNYVLAVLPAIEDSKSKLCSINEYNDSQLTYNAKMLFVYFLWFALARLSLFLPCIAARVAVVQSRTHGFCRTYCVHLIIRDGPLYIFVVGSLLFWFHLMQSPHCDERNPDLYQTLKLYAIYSCMVSVLCLLLAYWHNKLLIEAAREAHEPEEQSAPPDTISKLETVTYDESLFGDEEEKLYPSECAICLGTWEPSDVIKVTQCQHAFHEECIGNWLRTARTCALCRQDLTKAPPLSARGTPRVRSVPASPVARLEPLAQPAVEEPQLADEAPDEAPPRDGQPTSQRPEVGTDTI